jgi:hypothetical protein
MAYISGVSGFKRLAHIQPIGPQRSDLRQPTESLVNHQEPLKGKVRGELPIQSQMTSNKSNIDLQEIIKREPLCRETRKLARFLDESNDVLSNGSGLGESLLLNAAVIKCKIIGT